MANALISNTPLLSNGTNFTGKKHEVNKSLVQDYYRILLMQKNNIENNYLNSTSGPV